MYGFTLSLRDMFTSPLARISDALRRVNDQVEDLESNVDQMSNNSGSKLGGLMGVVTRLGAAFVTFESVKALFNIGVQAEQTNTKFEVLLGSAEKGRALLDQLTQYANFTPYSGEGMNKAAETMLGFGIAQERIMPNMRMLGDVAMGNEEKLGSLSLVYSQIMATGKLMGQDLLQLINTGFNPLQIISDQTGLSMGTLKDKMEKGAISSDMVSEAFRIATSQGGRYHNMAQKMSETAGGKWSTMMDAFAGVTRRVGLRFAEWVKPLFDIGRTVAEGIVPFAKSLMDIYTWITNCKPLLIFLAGIALALGINFVIANAGAVAFSLTLGILNGVIWLVNAATAAWNFVLSMNPISLVIIAIAALVAAVVYLWKKFDWFRGGVMGVWGVLKGLGDMIKNYVIGRVQELLKAIGTVGDALNALKNGEFSKALDLGKSALGGLVGIESAKGFIDSGRKLGANFNKGYAEGVAMGKPTIKGPKTGAPQVPKGPGASTTAFNSLLGGGTGATGTGKGKAGSGAKDKVGEKAASIVGGGAKQTTFNITIGKLQDQTVIHVDQTEKGINNLGDKVQEILLRAVNSVNQMQTT
ncbi:tape measure protein [Chryseobacterium sp. TY4]